MSGPTAERLRKLLHENQMSLQSDEREIALMESTGAPEPIVNAARRRLWLNQETDANLRSLIAEIQ
jgi:hypothetical protein